MKKKLYIIGAGTGSEDFLTQRALKLMESCDVIYSTAYRFLSDTRRKVIECPVTEIPKLIEASEGQNIVLLVSGDTGFFSIAGSLSEKLEDKFDIEVVCGISSLQYFCSKTGNSYEKIKVVSLHGRDENVLGPISYNSKVFVLTGGENKAHTICKSLSDNGLAEIKAIVGENLSMPEERIVSGTVKELAGYTFDNLAVMLLENPNYVNYHIPLSDEDFERGKVPMTKEEVRAITLAKLAVEPCDIVFDIGAGTGSVAVEMARRAFDGSVYAIEKNPEALELICKNRVKLGAYNVKVVSGTAPDIFAELPVPDRAFIGGSSGNMAEIVGGLMAINPRIHIVANTITIESLNGAINSFEENGFETEVVCINSSVSKKVGRYHMMNANNPVYIITGKKAHKEDKIL
ncbi:bifunctional cobalt-precorrin-7 (C(5))-methyltransferase/cobalt-precorrin-6B (C(15))-methyltransferase [Clostridium sp. BNL1100]|uniref:bifunctional cobalt-precorrin-7 (C(5))-methyltransferase/cobalt-precorrin-6B (C(15))-methyltransferase n=1 Tax=Clostridium sp. BNL1100 TaxID=755731 RepID=UPI00024A78EA|nr:bifunctional cobalt-precorrin-7 (C(5))-methyltransferase/cobalt-precorrin-6B (C(15))-methyltransferase [Clostridium sp. BNL1100]AEY65218.1 precorrin-6y C5,15-methyltransferase (decarboxylating), CbiE subunit,precorrin-6Y C5,15-methyltransferase (decarboxylating), CbiT subunit [Clostridium sp. BNL1100]